GGGWWGVVEWSVDGTQVGCWRGVGGQRRVQWGLRVGGREVGLGWGGG
ncbi:hypothetical protein HGQ98_19805, partial [Achromobacter ruhlandii]|nr:hypothetical protein [Achromobacter ruhlandii]